MFLSIIIPAFNESNRLPKTLKLVQAFLKQQSYLSEIIVVNDGSTDNIEEIIKLNFPDIVLLNNLQNSGKGASIKNGILQSRGDFILYMDADGSTPIEELNRLFAEMTKNNYDIVIGSRKDALLLRKRQAFYREFMGKTFNFIVRKLLNTKIIDTQCGFKLLKGNIARDLFKFITIKGFAFDVELLYRAEKQNYKILELPVIWVNDEESKVNIFRDPFIMLIDIIKLLTIK